jgi:hypothetical protein
MYILFWDKVCLEGGYGKNFQNVDNTAHIYTMSSPKNGINISTGQPWKPEIMYIILVYFAHFILMYER